MRRKIIGTFVTGIIILSGLNVVIVSSEETDYVKKTLCFSNLQINEKEEGITLELTGADSILLIEDYYMIPTRIETFTFPFGTVIENVKCTPKNINQQQLTKELMIAPKPIEKGETSITEDIEKPENPRSINTWYEYNVGCGIDGNQRKIIVKVQVFPAQYYPSEHVVGWADTIEIEIQYSEPEYSIRTFDEQYDLIVLTNAEFSDELSSLVDHKNARGVSTKLVTLEDVYNGVYFPVEGRDNPEKIKYFIKNTVEAWDAKYVLLVGGNSEFPTREAHVYVEKRRMVFVSDLYYADIFTATGGFSSWDTNENDVFGECNWGLFHRLTDKVDGYPDVYLGRLPCTTKAEVTTCVNKIRNYEINKSYTQDWFTHLVVIGGDTFTHDNDNVDEGEAACQVAIDIMDGFIPIKCWASEGTLNTVDSVNDAINAGAGFVCFEGHGFINQIGTHPHNREKVWIPRKWFQIAGLFGGYFNTDVLSLTNGDKLPIVIMEACDIGKYIARRNCFCWSFIINQNGGGIVSIGPTTLSLSGDGKYATQYLGPKLLLNFLEAYKIYQTKTFGAMWAKGVSNYISPMMVNYDYLTIEEWEPFGDPSLVIQNASQLPNFPPIIPAAPEGPDSGNAAISYTYSASTTDPEGDQISYLFDWGDGTYSEWTNLKNSGETTSTSHTWDSTGSFHILVRAKDSQGGLSRWSEPRSIKMAFSYDNSIPQFFKDHPKQ